MGLTALPPFGPGRQIGHYTILDRLGQGGMGEVFLALDRKLERQVAVKILSAEVVADGDRLRLFQHEARALAALNHPNIVTIFSVEEAEDSHLLVMEFVEGRTLRDVLPPHGLPLEQFFDVAIPLSEALAVAHEQGVTHRDLKPENVMLTRTGRVKVLDFGLAKIAQQARRDPGGAQATIAGPGAVLGTVPYLSPEQAEGRAIDHRADLFALGVVMHELVTGARPFDGDSAAQIVASILRDHPPPIERMRPDVPPELCELVRRCLEKDPSHRLQSARELHDDLEVISEATVSRGTPSGQKRRTDRPAIDALAERALGVPALLHTRWGLTLLMGILFVVNLIETTVESAVQTSTGVGTEMAHAVARAQRWIEGGLTFDRHDLTNPIAIYGYASVYFFVLPAMIVMTLVALARRRDIRPYRILCVTLAVTYTVCFMFYLAFPVPERWAFPESEAILLSDLWSSRLITAIRPISGLDNCFPSFHVASAVDVAIVCCLMNVRFRTVSVFAAAAVAASTFVLGIHWLPDMLAGACLAVISVWAALRIERFLASTPASPTVIVA